MAWLPALNKNDIKSFMRTLACRLHEYCCLFACFTLQRTKFCISQQHLDGNVACTSGSAICLRQLLFLCNIILSLRFKLIFAFFSNTVSFYSRIFVMNVWHCRLVNKRSKTQSIVFRELLEFVCCMSSITNRRVQQFML